MRRPQPPRTPSAPVRRCQRCLRRYAQRYGLCRTCGRETGQYDQATIDAHVTARRQALAALVTEAQMAQSRVVIVEGREYLSVWHGKDPLPQPADPDGAPSHNLGSTLSGHHFHVAK